MSFVTASIIVGIDANFQQLPELGRINRLVVALLQSGMSEKEIIGRLHMPDTARVIAIDLCTQLREDR